MAARFGDVHVFFAYEPETVAKDVEEVRGLAAEQPRRRPLEFGVRHCICVRETKEEARRTAERMIEGSDLGNTATWADSVRTTESTSQRRINEMAARNPSHWLTETIWMGINKVRGGGATMFVGTPGMVARQLRAYADAGVTHFIMHGYPYLEEAEIFGREVLPLLKDLGPLVLPEPAGAAPAR
ncbi:MAG: LLM class flavin-dependent oxidoreductase [Candidatus Tectomicrobia bacterium]|nr:LLM class flavin-dependent oxidoreductase [Candidatus Tectomicrobia bacterium]